MLKWLLLAATLIFCTSSAQAFFPRGVTSGPPGATCPQAIDNGCAASPGGSFQVVNFFTGYTGTSYAARPGYNVPGVDYAVGVPAVTNGGVCGMDHIQDPKTATTGANDDPGCGIIPQHCAYSESVISTALTVPQLICSGTSNAIVIRGFELGPVGGHNGTYLLFQVTATGNKTLEYNDFVGSVSTYYQNGFGSFASGSTGNVLFQSNNMFGKWLDNFSATASGTGSVSGTTLTITACTSCNFAVGQYIVGGFTTINNTAIQKQLTGSTGGVGTYQLNAAPTVASQGITAQFQMAGGMGLITNGDITFLYNAATQINGRVATAAGFTPANPSSTVANYINRYNYVEGGVYTFGVSHYEMIEYVLANGAFPVTYTNYENTGNLIYIPAAVAASSTTASFYISTGAVASHAATFNVTYTNVNLNNNVIVTIPAGSAALATWDHGVALTNLTMTGNYIAKGGSTNYTLCNGNPMAIGGADASGPVSFFTASDNGSGTMTVTAFLGGTPIIADGSNYVAESHARIMSQTSGTAGGAGVYVVTGDIFKASTGMRSAYPAIANTPTMSGNVEMTTGATISASTMIIRTLGTNPCVYPGMARLYPPVGRTFAANDNVKDADRRRAA